VKGEIIRKYRPAQSGRDVDDGQDFNRWLTANAVIASLFAAALVAMAIFAAVAPAPTQSADRDDAAEDVRQAGGRAHPALVLEDVTGSRGPGPHN
jgi:hypothetical protein